MDPVDVDDSEREEPGPWPGETPEQSLDRLTRENDAIVGDLARGTFGFQATVDPSSFVLTRISAYLEQLLDDAGLLDDAKMRYTLKLRHSLEETVENGRAAATRSRLLHGVNGSTPPPTSR